MLAIELSVELEIDAVFRIDLNDRRFLISLLQVAGALLAMEVELELGRVHLDFGHLWVLRH